MPRLVLRVLAVDGALLLDDLLDILHERVQLRVGAGVMDGESECPRADRELADHDGPELCRTVHQVLQVRRGQLERVGDRSPRVVRRPVPVYVELRRHLPMFTGRLLERDDRGSILEAVRPHQRRRHIDVRVVGVDRQIRAVDAIAVHLVLHGDERVDVVHVLREVVQRIAARRRPAHSQLERRLRQLRERRFDLHPPMFRLGERQHVVHGRRRVKRSSLHGDEDEGEKKASGHKGAC